MTARASTGSALCAALAIVLLVLPAVASAGQTRLPEGDFGSAAQPTFAADMDIAIDAESGEMLVVDAGAEAVYRFNPDGTPSEFPDLGSNAIDGKGGGECPAVPADCDQTPDNGFEFDTGEDNTGERIQIAIDRSGGPTDGNIYLAQGERPAVEIFAEDGAYLGRLGAAGVAPLGEVCGVAADGEGNVFVAEFAGKVHRFEPAASPPVNADHTATFAVSKGSCGLAAGAGPSAGALFLVDVDGNPFGGGGDPVGLFKLDAASGALAYPLEETTGSFRAVTVDPASGHAIAGWGGWVREFDASGPAGASEIAKVGAGTGVVFGVAAHGGKVYAGGGQSGVDGIKVLGPLVPFPDAATLPPSAVEETTVTLNGTVDADGGAVGECFFEYDTVAYTEFQEPGKLGEPTHGETLACAESAGEIEAGGEALPVHADLGGLQLGGEYHYRLVARNANGESKGADVSFKLKSPPVIAGAWAEDVGLREGRLAAEVNPEGFATTVHFEWGTSAAYGNETPAVALGSAKALESLSAFLDGLTPGTTYHFRLLATNAIGTSESEDRTFTTHPSPIAPAACPNDALRGGASAQLPDCRAYELVSPLDKNGGDINVIDGVFGGRFPAYKQGARGGGRITYSAGTAFGDAVAAPLSSQYLSSRDAGGWSTHGISPPFGTGILDGTALLPPVDWLLETLFGGFSEDLCSAWVKDAAAEPLDPRGLVGFANLYRRENCAGEGFEALTVEGPFGATGPYLNAQSESNSTGGNGPGLRFQGASDDLSHQVFASGARLTVEAAAGKVTQLYDFHDGELEVVNILPDGKAHTLNSIAGTAGATIGTVYSSLDNAVSADGSRIFWTAARGNTSGEQIGPGTLYVRVDGELTLPVSGAVGPDPARFWTAAEDGSAVLFTVGEDLYRFDVDAALAGAGEPAELIAGQVAGVLGAAEDLARVYFVSEADLAAGAVAGEWNLYLAEQGGIELVAALGADDRTVAVGGASNPVDPRPLFRNSRVSPDGAHIAFQSFAALSGYDNVDPATGKRYAEVFRYDAESGELACASCNPTGARPVGPHLLQPYDAIDNEFEAPVLRENFGQAATLPTCERELHCSRALSEDGSRVYFHSYEPLALRDTNGVRDVYQWEAPGSGSCEVGGRDYSALNAGCVSLISTGTSSRKSEFYDASADGRDVFFSTSSSIHPEDDGLIDVYDAREGGGLALPSPPPACEGEACRAPVSAPDDPTPASATFRGAGDPPAASRCAARARRAGKAARQAKRLRRQANRLSRRATAKRLTRARAPRGAGRRIRTLRRRSARANRQAKRLSRSAKRCRRARKGGSR